MNQSTPRKGRPPKHPFSRMEIGESVFIPGRTTMSLKGCVNHMKPEKRFRFCTGVMGGTAGVRVWRIS